MPSLLAKGKQQYFDNSGAPLVGGKLFTYAAGTTNPQATYADAQGMAPNPNPVILDGRGEAIIFWSGSYDVILQDALGNIIWSVQGVTEANLGARTSSTGSAVTPVGTTAQRDAKPVQGYLRYNTDLNCFEGYYSAWRSFAKTVNGQPIADGGDIILKTVGGSSMVGAGDVPIKTIGGNSMIGAGDITYKTVGGVSLFGAGDIAVQSPLVSGVNVKTINGASVLGAGNVTTASSMPRSARAANQMLAVGDLGSLIDYTTGGFTQTFDTPANLGLGWNCIVRNNSTSAVTIPSSDGIANWPMYPGEVRLFECDGVNINSAVLCAFTWILSATANFICPPGYNSFDIEGWGAGGGGGAGSAGQIGFGGCGGGGGAYFRRRVTATEIGGAGTLVSCTIGAGGIGGTGVSGNGITGNSGVAGGTTSFGSVINAPGGNGGPGGGATSAGINAVGVAGYTTQPYGGGTTSNSVAGANQIQPSPTILSGSAGGSGGMYNGSGSFLGAPGGARISGNGGIAAPAVNGATAAGNGAAFQGGGGGAAATINGPASLKGGDGGTASGGGGGGAQTSGVYPSGAGGKGGNGYMIIRGE